MLQTQPILWLLTLVGMATSDLRIHTLDQSPIIIVPLGPAKISTSSLRIVHPINLTSIGTIVENFNAVSMERLSNQTPFKSIVKAKLDKINLSYNRIKPLRRRKRWESLGKAWKYVSGSPDADDLKIINSSLNSLISENNKQIRINSAFDSRMSNITKAINVILENEENVIHSLEGFDVLELIFKIDELLYYLDIIEEAITLARRSIPSSRIIHLDELETIHHSLINDGFGLNSVDSILSTANAYAVLNNEIFMYILKIPRIKNVQYTLNFIEPVIVDHHRVHLQTQFYLKGQKSFMLKSACSKANAMFICSSTDLEPLTGCMQQLVSGNTAECPIERTYGNKTIRKINDGNIVVNAINVTLSSNCSVTQRTLQGSFLIQYSNCTLKLDDEEYVNTNMEIQPFIPTTGLKVNPTKLFNHIPLEHLQELHMEQRNHITHLNLTAENLHWKLHFLGWIASVISSTLLICILGSSIIIVLKFAAWKTLLTNSKPEVIEQDTIASTEAHPESREVPLILQQ
ncbi:uncharacterized protein LOC129778992 isoform X1 [Toxorhynchites rutilus septentrionalis]|uniref:uncharacterized protein LOC129767626 isoform X1 n=1 Tax=Toxorhynchites rutilus septentrionalis TaxID=329112 RepID=UPI0024783EC8|nr:uncharacterized protein LOC129767626 isoform X1 [Toxorhynchites rutilus septentrionalis]XP_055640725.1 uncharacterized protein LOC129778083 isoform X1 [Toxorhynchites rutilus septentrionalis]XP_055641794.1 uncharacterized protein LOC129778735 isoform X1 [Toxorhynchites rutilus septentrionalis]XP_055642195.1 uncharacterized protein LOC129778992 isoform X1 [Toxorhynchites rutilus septentrionalis]